MGYQDYVNEFHRLEDEAAAARELLDKVTEVSPEADAICDHLVDCRFAAKEAQNKAYEECAEYNDEDFASSYDSLFRRM